MHHRLALSAQFARLVQQQLPVQQRHYALGHIFPVRSGLTGRAVYADASSQSESSTFSLGL
jgi:hypothetical protein